MAWDVLNVVADAVSLKQNISAGNVGAAIVDAVALTVDTAAVVLPAIPAGLGMVVKAKRAEQAAVDAAKAAKAAANAAKETEKAAKAADKALTSEKAFKQQYKELGQQGAARGPGSGLANQTREQLLKSKASYEKLIVEHKQRLADYRSNPIAHDNQGLLRNAPSDAARQRIIEGRIKVLEGQIAKQEGELSKINNSLGE